MKNKNHKVIDAVYDLFYFGSGIQTEFGYPHRVCRPKSAAYTQSSIFLCLLLLISLPANALAYSIVVKISEQRMYLMKENEVMKTYPVSTSKYGIGNKIKSHKTPLGVHRIARKIGDGAPVGAIFDSKRRYTGKTAIIYTDRTELQENFELTRILWLEGMEYGVNKGKGIDSYVRLIYIHGTAEEGLIGTPASIGCIRMKNKDMLELFDLVTAGTVVEIKE